MNADWFEAIGAARVERASLGVQTLEPEVQAAIGRIQPHALIRKAVDELRRSGVQSLNFDLMYGLPRQGLGELESTLRAALALRPDRIALFGYAHVPHLIPRQRRIDDAALPAAELRFRQAELGQAILLGAGYRQIGFDHFALPDDPLATAASRGALRRNFQGFTDDPANILIGLGASAISQFPDLLIQNDKNAGRYRIKTSSRLLPAERGVVRGKDDQRRGEIIERLLCDGQANIDSLASGEYIQRLDPFLALGLARLVGSTIHLASDAWPYARAVASQFDSYRHPAAQRFSAAI